MISCLGSRIFVPFGTAIDFVFEVANSHNLCVQVFALLFFLLFCVLYVFMTFGVGYTLLFVSYCANTASFFYFDFTLETLSFWIQFLLIFVCFPRFGSLYICLFPQIKNCMTFSFGRRENIEPEYILPRLLERFEIKPPKIMSVVPSSVQKRKDCLVECLDTLIFCFLIFAFGFVVSAVFVLSGGSYF